jgi:hypothetical protein
MTSIKEATPEDKEFLNSMKVKVFDYFNQENVNLQSDMF